MSKSGRREPKSANRARGSASWKNGPKSRKRRSENVRCVILSIFILLERKIKMNLNILLLGLTSLITDVSSEMIMPILPMFIAALGGSAVAVGLIGGLGDALAALLNVISGWFSDRIGKRKPIVASGYALSAFSKLLYPFSQTWIHLLILRPLERTGKGIRDAPRDAIIARSVRMKARGRGFGIHRALDTLGAILGSVLAFLFIWIFLLDFRSILWISAFIAFLALIPLVWVRDEPSQTRNIRLLSGILSLPRKLKLFILLSGIFGLSNFTYMFFILRAQQVFPETLGVLGPVGLYIIFNLVYALGSIPAGMLSDRIGRKSVILSGWLLFSLVCFGFTWLQLQLYFLLFGLYGLSYALFIGNQRAYVSDLAGRFKGTSLGFFHTISAISTLLGSVIAGVLWQAISPEATFTWGSLLALLASIGLVII